MVPATHIGTLLRSVSLDTDTHTEKDTFPDKLRIASADSLSTEIIVTDRSARYKLGDVWRVWAGDEVVDFLEDFELDLEDPQFSELSIYKIHKALRGSGVQTSDLEAVSLADYFTDEESDFHMLEDDHLASPVEKLKNAEHLLLSRMLKACKWTDGYYKPFPILNEEKQLAKMVYLVYDASLLRSKYGGRDNVRRWISR